MNTGLLQDSWLSLIGSSKVPHFYQEISISFLNSMKLDQEGRSLKIATATLVFSLYYTMNKGQFLNLCSFEC